MASAKSEFRNAMATHGLPLATCVPSAVGNLLTKTWSKAHKLTQTTSSYHPSDSPNFRHEKVNQTLQFIQVSIILENKGQPFGSFGMWKTIRKVHHIGSKAHGVKTPSGAMVQSAFLFFESAGSRREMETSLGTTPYPGPLR